MRALAGGRAFVDLKRIALDELKPAGELLLELLERGNASSVAFDGDDRCSGVEKRTSQSPGTRADLIDSFALERTGNSGNPRQQLPVEDEILAE
jgi:hypothetical protein